MQICNDMLEPYMPVQHLARGPPDDSIFINIEDKNQGGLKNNEIKIIPDFPGSLQS